jgi:hypothetical protein
LNELWLEKCEAEEENKDVQQIIFWPFFFFLAVEISQISSWRVVLFLQFAASIFLCNCQWFMFWAFCFSPPFFLCVISSNTFSALLSFFQTPFQAFICYQTPNSHFYFHFLKKQSTSKHYNFFHLLNHINNFLTIQIKKSLQYNFFFFTFPYKFFLLYTTSITSCYSSKKIQLNNLYQTVLKLLKMLKPSSFFFSFLIYNSFSGSSWLFFKPIILDKYFFQLPLKHHKKQRKYHSK